MTLVVETGEAEAGADSYVALAAYQTYGINRGWDLAGDDADEVNLRRAFDGLNRLWIYLGAALSSTQVGAFPRTLWDGIPQQIKDAQCELAFQIQGGLDPFVTIANSPTSESIKIGPISIGGESLPIGKPQIVAVEGLLRPFLGAGAGQAQVLRG
ncbi:MAG: hypothetical protein JXR13_18715 [Thalassovita sp.]